MSVSHKYKTFDQLLEEVTIDFQSYALEGMIEPQQLIKVAIRVNYDLGLRINRTKEVIVDVEHGKGQLPSDFYTLNYAFVCDDYEVSQAFPSGTHIDTTQPKYTPAPGEQGPCEDPECKDVCTIKTCPEEDRKGRVTYKSEYMVVQRYSPTEYRTYTRFYPLRITETSHVDCDCPNLNTTSHNQAEIKDGYLLTTFTTGKVYMSYQATMEDSAGDLLVLDHPYCNEYYEYALKQRILENMLFSGENVSQQLGLIEGRLRASRNNALGFVNTPNFEEMRKFYEVSRRAEYNKYYDMFRSHPPVNIY
jgi:hypothetical protein